MTALAAPAPGAAPLRQQVLAHARLEARMLLRNPEQLLLGIVIPLLILIGGDVGGDHLTLHLHHRLIDELSPGVLALTIMSTSFTSAAISTGFERRYGVIKRLGATPLPRVGYLVGKALALLFVELLQLIVIGAVALTLGWHPSAGILQAIVAWLLGTLAFTSLGLLVAGALRPEATLAVANLVFLLLMAGGAVVLPIDSYGDWGPVAQWLPSGALGEALRSSFLDNSIPWRDYGVLVLWAVLGSTLTATTFPWE